MSREGDPSLKRQRVVAIGLALLCLSLALSACGLVSAPKEPLDLTILHTGQVIGEISPCG